MVGITLSPEQSKSAPPEVRQWLEHEIAASLGLGMGSEILSSPPQLAACTLQEAEAIYASVRGMFPVVNVFFELGREGASIGHTNVEAFRLLDMFRHTRLSDMQQLGSCLQLIGQAFREIRTDGDATLFLLDQRGHCIVAAETQRNILALWTRMTGAQQIAQRDRVDDPNPMPPSAVHLDGAFPEVRAFDRPASTNDAVQK